MKLRISIAATLALVFIHSVTWAEGISGQWFAFDQREGSKTKYEFSETQLQTANMFYAASDKAIWENERKMDIVKRDGVFFSAHSEEL